jgi:hypothetical protein
MNILEIAAFSDGLSGGNPAGVSFVKSFPSATDMQRIAAKSVSLKQLSQCLYQRVGESANSHLNPKCHFAGAILIDQLADNLHSHTFNRRFYTLTMPAIAAASAMASTLSSDDSTIPVSFTTLLLTDTSLADNWDVSVWPANSISLCAAIASVSGFSRL